MAALGAFAFASCKSEETPDAVEPQGGNTITGGSSGSGGVGTTPDAGSSGGTGGTSGAPQNCDEMPCSGPSTCVLTNGVPECVCDEGYTKVSNECVVDEECVKLRLIEPKCRQLDGVEPSVAMLFDVATCAGTTVKPEVLGNVSSAFAVLENGTKLGQESYATVLERDVESYVVIAIDLSTSVTERTADLPALREHLKALVRDLEPGVGESPVYVQLIPFGRSTVPALQQFSADFDLIADKIDDIFDDPSSYVPEPNGTNLNGVINKGVQALEDKFKDVLGNTRGGVVSTGTVLSITDGDDNSGVKLVDRAARYNLISVGISDDVDNKELTRVGAQGSFLAPTPADWQASFEAVAQRVAEYPRRSYMLAYCSPALDSQQTIAVTWANGTAKTDATCKVDANDFGEGIACNAAFLAGYCTDPVRSCGGFLACGPCTTDAGDPVQDWIPDAEDFY
jgi:von Willebrand factor type A domain-containing protein